MKRLPPDNRLSWRDLDMPLVRNYTMPNGTRKTEVDPDYERRYRGHMLHMADAPSWRDDPTYYLRRKDKR